MAAEKPKMNLAWLSDEAIDLVTSYLPLQSLWMLFATGNVALVQKLLAGGVKTLNCVDMPPLPFEQRPYLGCYPSVPRLVVHEKLEGVLWRGIPQNLWSRLRTLTFSIGPKIASQVEKALQDIILSRLSGQTEDLERPAIAFFPILDMLPSSLTSLDWSFAWSFMTRLGSDEDDALEDLATNTKKITKKLFPGPTLAERLPNLRHLSISYPSYGTAHSDLRYLLPNSPAFCACPDLPFLFRTHPTHFWISQLPPHLVSLRLPIAKKNKKPLFGKKGLLGHLPSTLTHLSLVDDDAMSLSLRLDGVRSHYQIALTQEHFQTPLPASITDLRLMPFVLEVTEDSAVKHFGWPNLELKHLVLYQVVNKTSFVVLPPTLTYLSTVTPARIVSVSNADYNRLHSELWPQNLTSLNTSAKKIDLGNLQFPPNLITLSFNDAIPNVLWNFSDLFQPPLASKHELIGPQDGCTFQMNAFSPTIFPVLQRLQLEHITLCETQLFQLGQRELDLDLFDVSLCGRSLPMGCTALDTHSVLSDAFWQYWCKKERLRITLRAPEPLERISSHRFYCPPKVTSITLPELGGVASYFMPHSLTRWHFGKLHSLSKWKFSKSLTSLHASSDSASISLRLLVEHCPHLTTLKNTKLILDTSYLPITDFLHMRDPSPVGITDGTIQPTVESDPAPSNCVSTSSDSSSLKHQKKHKKKKRKNDEEEPEADTALPLPLHLPNDAIAQISAKHPHLHLEECTFDTSQLLKGCENFPTGFTHATFEGEFVVDMAFISGGFAHCIEMKSLDLTKSSFVSKEPTKQPWSHSLGSDIVMPNLPPSLETLTLGLPAAQCFLRNSEKPTKGNRTVPWLPTTLSALHLNGTEGSRAAAHSPTTVWSSPIIPSLEHLSIRKAYISPDSLTIIPPSFKIVQNTLTGPTYHLIAVRDESKPCSIM